MKSLKQSNILISKIDELKTKQANDLSELKAQYKVFQDGISVKNIIEEGVSEFYKTATNNNNLFTTIASILGGFISNKIVVGDSKNVFKKIVGYGVQFTVTKLLSKINNK